MINQNLKTSQNGLNFIAQWEGCVLKPYKDVAGLRTIGVGHLITPNENFPDGVAITKDQALQILAVDSAKCEAAIKKAFANVDLTQNMFDALVSFGFNCGTGTYTTSGVGKCVAAGDFAHVPERLLDWCKATINGKKEIVPGLYSRRKAEGELFLLGSGVSPVWSPEMQATMAALGVPWTKATLSDAQAKLKKLGLYNSTVDGIWGPGTNNGLVSFAGQKGVKVGDLSKGAPQALLDELKKV